MPLLPIPSPTANWADEVYAEAITEFDGEVQVSTPGTPGKYDSKTDTRTGGTPGEILVDWRPGRAQEIGSPQEIHDGNGWATKRRFIFQLENRATDPLIPQGAIIRFRGGDDHTLATFAFQASSSVGSSRSALRTIRAATEGVAVA